VEVYRERYRATRVVASANAVALAL